jgi:hypothetical protein
MIAVQVDGRLRTRIEVDPAANEAQVVVAAIAAAGGIEPSRVISVPGRLTHLVS